MIVNGDISFFVSCIIAECIGEGVGMLMQKGRQVSSLTNR